MKTKKYNSKEEILYDIVKAQDELFEEMNQSEGIFIEKSKLDKLQILNDLLKDFDKKK